MSECFGGAVASDFFLVLVLFQEKKQILKTILRFERKTLIVSGISNVGLHFSLREVFWPFLINKEAQEVLVSRAAPRNQWSQKRWKKNKNQKKKQQKKKK